MTHKPYISPSLSLYHAQAHDVLRMLPENSVDALITDPPYSSGATHKAWPPFAGAAVLRVLN